MDIIQELYYLKGQLKVIERLRGKEFTPCRQSNKLKHYLESQYISLTTDIEIIEDKLNQ